MSTHDDSTSDSTDSTADSDADGAEEGESTVRSSPVKKTPEEQRAYWTKARRQEARPARISRPDPRQR